MARDVAQGDIDVLEVNISCPTRDPKGGNFALHAEHTYDVIKLIRATTDKPVWVKLSPNAGEIVTVAQAAERAGANAIAVSNTLLGLKIDPDTFRPAIGNEYGGISGPGIKPASCAWCINARKPSKSRSSAAAASKAGRGRIYARRRSAESVIDFPPSDGMIGISTASSNGVPSAALPASPISPAP